MSTAENIAQYSSFVSTFKLIHICNLTALLYVVFFSVNLGTMLDLSEIEIVLKVLDSLQLIHTRTKSYHHLFELGIKLPTEG